MKICNEEFKFNKKFSLTKDKLESMIYSTTIIFEQIKTIDYINNTKNKNANNTTKPHINNIDAVISAHKNIFFNEIENLNKIINNIS